MRFSRVFVALALAGLAGLLVPVTGNAGTGPHQAVGIGQSSQGSIVILAPIDEASQSGTVLASNVNATGVTVNITCVAVDPFTPPGYHKLHAEGTGGGLKWFIEIGDSPSGDALDVSQGPVFYNSSTPCDWGALATTVTLGNFVITP